MHILAPDVLTPMLLPFRAQTNPDPSPKPNPDQTHSWRRSQYEWIVLTRLDFLGGVTLCDSSVERKRGPECLLPPGMGSIWELMAAQRLDMIGRREGKSGYRIEDRLMLGRRATMLRLESAYAHYTSGTLRATAGANSGIAAPSKCRGSQFCSRGESPSHLLRARTLWGCHHTTRADTYGPVYWPSRHCRGLPQWPT